MTNEDLRAELAATATYFRESGRLMRAHRESDQRRRGGAMSSDDDVKHIVDDAFKQMWDAVQQANANRGATIRRLEQAWAKRADLDARMTQMEETVASLRALVMEHGALIREHSEQIRALRARLNGDTPA
jgi:septal ring factor EnvC (AmiA/AmiB activator)